MRKEKLSWSWNKQIHPPKHHLCGLLPLLGKTWPKKKSQPKSVLKQTMLPQSSQATDPLLPGSGWRGQSTIPLCCLSQTGHVLAAGAQGGEASCDLQTRAQLSPAQPVQTTTLLPAWCCFQAPPRPSSTLKPLELSRGAKGEDPGNSACKHFSEWMLEYNFLFAGNWTEITTSSL